MEYPRLIESNVRHYLGYSLGKCHEYKSQIYSWVFNIGIFFVFVITVGLVLYFKKRRELSPWEREEKMLREQNYILSKIREYQIDQKRHSSMITDLPVVGEGGGGLRYDPDAGLEFSR